MRHHINSTTSRLVYDQSFFNNPIAVVERDKNCFINAEEVSSSFMLRYAELFLENYASYFVFFYRGFVALLL